MASLQQLRAVTHIGPECEEARKLKVALRESRELRDPFHMDHFDLAPALMYQLRQQE